ncbi:MAG: hypothetical protein ACRDGQ_00850, partial [Candidatus Limnocylindrales bacterium]
MIIRPARALLLALGLLALLPAVALAHPLGNFTVNHYAGIRVEPDRIVLDVVIDEAEIPTFQDRLRIDTDGDGVISAAEAEVERLAACPRLVPGLALTVGGQPLALDEFGAGLSFPPGTAGLSTMRLVCEFTAGLSGPIGPNTRITFADTSHAGRIGWHEVVVTGSGVTIAAGNLPTTSISNRLRAYPTNLIAHPLAVNNVVFRASPGGPLSPYLEPADALPLDAAPSSPATSPASSLPVSPPVSPPAGAISSPAGVALGGVGSAGQVAGPSPSASATATDSASVPG